MNIKTCCPHADRALIERFPHSDESALFIETTGAACRQSDVEQMVNALPADYQLHLPANYARDESVHYTQYSQLIAADLRDKVGNLAGIDLLAAEVDEALQVLAHAGREERPLASLRVVTEEYVKKEFPSVSEKYHRDSTSLTITKCFYGDGIVFTDEHNIKREFFLGNSIAVDDRHAVFDVSIEHEVPDDKWVLLKGEMWRAIDARSQELFDYILGPTAAFNDVFKGCGFIHKGGYFRRSTRRFVFTASTWNTRFGDA